VTFVAGSPLSETREYTIFSLILRNSATSFVDNNRFTILLPHPWQPIDVDGTKPYKTGLYHLASNNKHTFLLYFVNIFLLIIYTYQKQR
jgi:hypothetical protein